MQNVIWSNDTDRIDSIVDYWKEEAARLSEDMAKDPKGTIDDAFWPVTDILNRAWRQAVSDYELPTAARLIEIIDDLDPYATGIATHAVDENNADRRDECGNLERLELGQPVVFVGTAGLWDGRRTIASIVATDNIGDIIADSTWNTRHGASTGTTTCATRESTTTAPTPAAYANSRKAGTSNLATPCATSCARPCRSARGSAPCTACPHRKTRRKNVEKPTKTT